VRLSRAASVLVAIAAPLALVRGLFTTTRIFYVRDLSFFFWSRHLWLRHTIFSGDAPWWDPYVAGGQSAVADALNQLAMPVTLAVRLLPSDVVSFNLWVALPLPIAALGTYVFLSRRLAAVPAARDWAAAFGAVIFASSGAIASMLNTPNLAWSVAFAPWVLASASPTGIAIAFGLQGLCGEPVTWASTAVIAAFRIVLAPPTDDPSASQSAVGRKAHLMAGLVFGTLIASAQLVPTVLASVRAHRGLLATPDFWSLHPLSLWDTLAPHVFGNSYEAFLADLPWTPTLNFGREPFFYSLYVGPLVLMLACAGAARLRRNGFWVAVALLFTIAALGGYTPAYPLLRRLVPALLYFRFPVKYIVFAVFALAVLAADGWTSMRNPWPAAIAAGGVLALTLVLLAVPQTLANGALALGAATHLDDPAAGAQALVRAGPPLALRAGALLLAGAFLVALGRRRRPSAMWLLAGLTAVDLLAVNRGLNPTMEVARLSPPAWFTAAAGSERLYIGGRLRGYMNTADPDGASWQIAAERSVVEAQAELNAELPMAPSGWRVREALSYDLPRVWPAGYEATVERFEQASREERDAFLRRTAVRWCVLPAAQPRPWRPVADVAGWNMRVYECGPRASRLAVTSGLRDADALFDRASDEREDGAARLVEDRATRVTIEATAERPAFLVLRDSYDPSWRAEVDGHPAAIERADGIYRAVPLTPGRHVVRFTYRPRDFIAGLTVTMTGVLLIAVARLAGPGRTRTRRDRGFTLIELMVVLAIIAILLAIAFNEYRNMQARGNEASALSSLRSIAAAQWQFATTCGNMKYATALPGLGQPTPATGQPFLSPDLTSAETIEKSGYVIHMAGKPLNDAPPACNGAAVADGYAATADPLKPGVSGAYFYGVNADRVLYLDEEKSFKEDLPESGNAPHGSEVK
jgi:prepilin-type N-terminal cleavage/methylation domain-containing protein